MLQKRHTKILLTSFLLAIALLVITGCAPESKSPKNVIIFISDGCGYNQILATDYFQHGKTGEQVYQQFPVRIGMSTYSTNFPEYDPDSAWANFNYVRRKPTDSAASATAMSTGIKTYNGAIGVDTSKTPLHTMVEFMDEHGKATGVVTSVLFTHATPAGFVAHNESRRNYAQIGMEMINNSALDVIMGCGHPYYNDNGKMKADSLLAKVKYKTFWDSLMQIKAGNDSDGDGEIDYWTYIEDHADFQKYINGDTPDRLFGLAKTEATLQQKRDGDKNADPHAVSFIETVPTLKEMSMAAINVLDEDDDGFFLMIEGGAIDWAGHANQSGRMIEEEIEFNKAIEAVCEWVEKNSSWNKTLVIVTGDHETGYLTGPGSGEPKGEPLDNPKDMWKPIVNNGKGVLPGMEWHSGGHTNSLIPFFAKGKGSERYLQKATYVDPIRGKYINNIEIAKVIHSLYETKK